MMKINHFFCLVCIHIFVFVSMIRKQMRYPTPKRAAATRITEPPENYTYTLQTPKSQCRSRATLVRRLISLWSWYVGVAIRPTRRFPPTAAGRGTTTDKAASPTGRPLIAVQNNRHEADRRRQQPRPAGPQSVGRCRRRWTCTLVWRRSICNRHTRGWLHHREAGAVLDKNIWGPGPSSFGRQQRAELLCPIVQY